MEGKVVDDTEMNSENEQDSISKKSRGRPPKKNKVIKPVSDESQVKRGRGRPRIYEENADDESEQEVPAVKKGRGRPPKIKEDVSDDSEQEVPTVKRSRGRPRIYDKADQPVVLTVKRARGRPRIYDRTDEPVVLTVKRARGRPRIYVRSEEPEQEVPTVKKGRGRPPKNKENDHDESDQEETAVNTSAAKQPKNKLENSAGKRSKPRPVDNGQKAESDDAGSSDSSIGVGGDSYVESETDNSSNSNGSNYVQL